MTTYIQDKNGKTIDSSIAKKPQFRHFREAWVINGDVISEDLATAKTLLKDKIREVRKPLLELEDINYMRALEDGNTAKAKEIADKLRKNVTVDWSVRESVRARIRLLIKALLKKYKYPPDKQREAIDLVLSQAEVVSGELVEV